ncbi:MAG TPA: 5-formyltetrahydrofolate cyclo-ligase [Flavisolibacter sp.]
MLKKDVRKMFRELRRGISPSNKMKWDDLLLIRFQEVEWPFVEYVLSFYPIDDNMEVNTFLLTDYLHFRNPNLQICYPKMTPGDNAMQAVVCNADSIFESNASGIPEPLDTDTASPDQLDLVIIPLLGFDEKGFRVGYGKGYYDRFLKLCRPDCIKVGVSYFEAVPSIDDADDFDVPLDLCITPQRTYVF